jgi:hypothetical protein
MFKKNYKQIWLFILVFSTLVGGSLRFYNLDSKGLWSDELTTAGMVLYHPLIPDKNDNWFHRINGYNISDDDTFWTAKSAEQTPILFDLIAKLSTFLFGPTEIGLRLPSALASLFLILWLLYKYKRTGNRDEKAVLLWTIFLSSFSCAFVTYSQEARCYSLGTLFAGILSFYWYERWNNGFLRSTLPKFGEIFVFVLACNTHYLLVVLSGIFLSSYGALALYRWAWRDLFKLSIVPLSTLPWFFMNFHTFVASSSGGYSPVSLLERDAAISKALYLTSYLVDPTIVIIGAISLWAVLARILFSRDSKLKSHDFLKPAFILANTIIIYIIFTSQVVRSSGVWNERFFVFILPAIYLFLGIAFSRLGRHPLITILVASLILSAHHTSIQAHYSKQKEGYREAANWLAAKSEVGATVVTTWKPNRNYYRYYLERSNRELKQISISDRLEAADVCNYLEKKNKFGVLSHASHYKSMIESLMTCNGKFEIVESVSYPNVIAQIYKAKSGIN